MKKAFPISLAIIFMLAVVLRFSTVGRNSLWFDEAWGVFRANQPLASTLTGDIEVGRPPLYYAGLHYWVNWFGNSEFSVRMPSAFASLLSVALVFSLGCQIGNRRIAWVVMGLLAFSPLHIWYGQEVRMYIFVSCLGLIAANGLVWKHWLAILPVTAALAGGLYVDFPMIPLWIALSGVFWVYWWLQGRARRGFIVWSVSTCLATLLYQPWWSRVSALFDLLNNIFVFRQVRQALHLPEFSSSQYIMMMLSSCLAFVLLAGLFYKLWQQDRIRRTMVPVMIFLFLLFTVVFAWPRLFGVKRVLVTGWPYVCLLAAALVVEWERRYPAILYASLGISLLTAVAMVAAVPKDDWRGAVSYINSNVQADDVVWIDPGWNTSVYEYYRAGPPAHYGNEDALKELAMANIWLVAERFPGQAIPSSPSEAWLNNNMHLVKAVPFYRLEVRLYRPDK